MAKAVKKVKKKKGDLKETIEEARVELKAERSGARYTAEGVLLNPEDFQVQPDGTLKPRG